MKAMQKIIGRLIVGCVLACCLTVELYAQNRFVPWLINGQPSAQNNSSAESAPVTNQESEPLEVQINSLPQVPPAMIPSSGTFWSLQGSLDGGSAPLPFNPFTSLYTNLDVKVFSFQDGSFLMNDINVDYAALTSSSANTNTNQPVPYGGGPRVFSFA